MFDVVILAGGLGTRLRSVVSDVPKCMAPVFGRPFLDWILKWTGRFDVNRIILSLGHLSNIVTDWIESEHRFIPAPIDWVIEETPLGTGGGIRLAMQKVTCKHVIVLNGDTFFNVDLDALCLFSETCGLPLTVALKPMNGFDRYGSVTLDGNGRITSFNEKRYCDKGLINGGVYCMDSSSGLLEDMPDKFSFEKDLLEPLSGQGILSGFVSDGAFIDIGIPEDWELAQTFIPSNIK